MKENTPELIGISIQGKASRGVFMNALAAFSKAP
jgi:hypothetical protein